MQFVRTRRSLVLVPVVAALFSFTARADEPGCDIHDGDTQARLCTYEPNTIGYTWDRDDVGFMDFKISLRYQLFPETVTDALNYVAEGLGNKQALYVSFTGRFGQYLGTRDSSPVIAKRFNPKAFIRHWTDTAHDGYIDFAYAHESNGQSIHTPEQFAQAQAAAERPEFANDQLSRGWDYLELAWKKAPFGARREWSTYLTLKYFLKQGLLQGEPEEYNGQLERSSEGKPRSHVDGVSGMLKYHLSTNRWRSLKDFTATVGYETGYRNMFRHSTIRLDLGTTISQLPVHFWYRAGYGSDLAQYYKKVSSRGIEVQIGSF